MKYLIIGNSAAAVGCVEGIRQVDQEGEITIVSTEPHHVYSRPLISYLILGKTDEQRMKYRGDDFYEKNGVTALLGRTATKIDPDGKKVSLDDGSSLAYDKLLVATGSKPFVPPAEGLDQVEKSFTFMTLDSAKALAAALTKESRVLIVGAGLIGLKCAEGITGKVASIDVVDMADRILPSILDEHGSAMVMEHIQKQGIRFHLSTSVAQFKEGAAFLKNGEELPFDILVMAVGVRPNTELVRDAGGEVGRGIVTDETCRTTLPDIYAAGDCTESWDVAAGQRRVLALLPNAYMQGETAGIDMAGGERKYNKAIPMNAIGFWGLHIITAGSYDGEAYVDEKPGAYKKLVTRDGVLKGYILIGDVARAGIYTSMIRERTGLDTVDFELLKQKPQLMAFRRSDRAKMLGGAH